MLQKKTLKEVIEQAGGVVMEIDNEPFGPMEVLLNYDDFLLILMEENRGCFYDEGNIYLLRPNPESQKYC